MAACAKPNTLEQWYGLSDPQCEDACRDRLSFRRFLGLSLSDAVPGEPVLVRFLQRLAEAGLMERLLGWLNEAFEARGLVVKRGTLIDATVVRSARSVPPRDPEARDTSDPEATWQAMKDRPVHGFKVHLAADEAHTLVRAVSVTPAHVHDSVPANDLIQQEEQAVYADKAYDSRARADFLAGLDIDNRILKRGARNRQLSGAERAHNREHSAIRAGVERVPGWFKANSRMARCRYLGVIKNQVHAHLLAMAYNLCRVINVLIRPPRAAKA